MPSRIARIHDIRLVSSTVADIRFEFTTIEIYCRKSAMTYGTPCRFVKDVNCHLFSLPTFGSRESALYVLVFYRRLLRAVTIRLLASFSLRLVLLQCL